MKTFNPSYRWVLTGAVVLCFAMTIRGADARHAQETVLHSFGASGDGGEPVASLAIDKAGYLYGTTLSGGADEAGTVFRVAPDGSETVLHSFQIPQDGYDCEAGLIRDRKGNLYGTATFGGAFGDGVVFRINPDGSESILHSFSSAVDGRGPVAPLIADKQGNFYGTTLGGGPYNAGVVFKLAPDGTMTVLHAFGNGQDGALPRAGVIMDKAGNLFGTTSAGGTHTVGSVFELAPDGTETVLYSFGSDGMFPYGGVVQDDAGNLYGTTTAGGKYAGGIAFKVAPDGTGTVLHSFGKRNDGNLPYAGILLRKGNLYGTTWFGGSSDNGVVFKISRDGAESVVYSFSGGETDGQNSNAALIADESGNLYGTTASGGANGDGTVFKLQLRR